MQTSASIDKIAPALVKAQAELKHALKDSTNPHFKSKYADLGSVWAAVKPALTKHELAALQDCGALDGAVSVGTRLIHSSGQWLAFDPVIIPLSKRDAQGVGSALTYARRYSLSAALGVVADEDDDGNAASNGNGADAHDPTKVKNPPGRSAIASEIREHVREFHACTDGDTLLAYINSPAFKKFAVRVCCDYPNDWMGPEDNSGLSGVLAQVGEQLGIADDVDNYISKVEAKRREKQQAVQHMQAAQ